MNLAASYFTTTNVSVLFQPPDPTTPFALLFDFLPCRLQQLFEALQIKGVHLAQVPANLPQRRGGCQLENLYYVGTVLPR